MTPNRGRIPGWLTALPVCLVAAGCYTPGGGWTMRAGIDVRTCKKPAAFVELVDTRWDESNRIAEINMMGGYVVTTAPAPSPASTPATGPHLLEGVAVPPASDPGAATFGSQSFPAGTPGNPGSGNPSAAGDATGDEPGRLPISTDSPAKSPLPGLGPVSSRDLPDGPSISAPTTDSTAYTQTGATATAANRPRRPMASRLFSRPR